MSKTAAGGIRVTTNATRDSVCLVGVEPVRFAQLWGVYPKGNPYVDPASGRPPAGYENQCAIRVSVALHRAGVQMKSYQAKDRIRLDGLNTAALAENLAAWLKLMPFCGLPARPEDVSGSDWYNKINNRTGIVFFKDYWARSESQTSPAGDHIDLWNRDALTGGFATFVRFTLGISSSTFLRISDLGKARQILFWEIR